MALTKSIDSWLRVVISKRCRVSAIEDSGCVVTTTSPGMSLGWAVASSMS